MALRGWGYHGTQQNEPPIQRNAKVYISYFRQHWVETNRNRPVTRTSATKREATKQNRIRCGQATFQYCLRNKWK